MAHTSPRKDANNDYPFLPVDALDAYEKALELEPANAQAKAGVDAVKRAINAEAKADGMGGDPTAGLGGMFNDPQLIQKLANNPKTSRLLADQDFMRKLQRVRQNPQSIGEEMRDPRFLQVMGALLGIDMEFGKPEGDGDGPAAGQASGDSQEDEPMPDATSSSSRPSEPHPAPKSEPEPEPVPEPEDEDIAAKKKAKEEAEAEKKLGTECYKKRQFDAAIEHYSKAWELHKDITYLTNLGAAKFEKGDYEGCIEACQKAIDEGREMLADFKLVAKCVMLIPPPATPFFPHHRSSANKGSPFF